MRTVPLGDVCEFSSGGTPDRSNDANYFGDIPWITGADIKGDVIAPRSFITESGISGSAARVVPPGTILLVTRTSVGKAVIADRALAFSQDLTALMPREGRLGRRYLLHFLRSKEHYFMRHARGATIKGVARGAVAGLEVPDVSVPEQRRIADILDKADALLSKRRKAIAHLGYLNQSIFREVFGHAHAAKTVSLSEVLRGGLRNGLSPSSSGSMRGDVLTLSAITGSGLDLEQKKSAFFDSEFHAGQLLRVGLFLVCRGNGNKALVGTGKVVRQVPPVIGYPDTIIAGDIDDTVIEPAYLEEVWKSADVRGQVGQGARTTNGTFKINQAMLGRVSFPLPSTDLQREFARRVAAVERLISQNRAQLDQLDDLFKSLQDRAFKGEL